MCLRKPWRPITLNIFVIMLLKIIRPLVLAAIVAFLTPGCDIRSEKYSGLVEPGVSASLADLRRDLISDVSYRITLSVPSEKDSAITGHETVSFHSSSSGSIPLDFTRSENEHIILRAKKGTNSFDLDFVSDNRFLNRNEGFSTVFSSRLMREAFSHALTSLT